MAVTRIKNNQITDSTINAAAKVQGFTITGGLLANNITYGSDFTVQGNLTVQGNTTTIDTNITTIEDPVIVLASTQTGSPTVDIGFIGQRGTSNNVAFVWQESSDEFITAFTSTAETNTVIAVSSYANFKTLDANVTGNLVVAGTSGFTGNITTGNILVGANKAIDAGNNIIGNVADPLANTDAATKAYVDSQVSSGVSFDITDGVTTQTISNGNTITFSGVANETTVTVSAVDTVTIGLPANVTVTGALSADSLNSSTTVSATGNITGGNVLTGGIVSATGDVSGGNITTAGAVSATANVTGGNLVTGGVVTATANVTGGNLVTGGQVSATGNVTGGNVTTGGAVSATANVTGGNLVTGGLATVTGNITGGNVLSGGVVSAVANVTGGNILTAGLISATGTITSAANVIGGNLTTAGDVSATGLVSGGNVAATGNVSATGNVIGGNLVTNTLTTASGDLTINAAGGDLDWAGAGNVRLGNRYINDLADPVANQDGATKAYVDNMVSTGLAYHQAVYAATTANLATTTGGTITYSQPNGAGNGIGATITTTGSFNLIDTANVQTANTRILVKNEGNLVLNGVYYWANSTAIIRTQDADEYGPNSAEQFSINDYFFVTNGNINAGSAWVVDQPTGTITFGTSNIAFAQFSSSQTYTANTAAGISITGTVINAKVDNETTAFDGTGNISVKAGANLTSPNIGNATGNSLTLTGNGTVTATTLSATGNVIGGNITTGGAISATGNIDSGANIYGGNLLTGGIVSATGNVTSTGNVSGGNLLTGGAVSATGNVAGGNITTAGAMSATGTITGGNVDTAGTVSATGNVTGGNILTAGQVSATGNVTGNYILGNGAFLTGVDATQIQFGTSNVKVVTANGNVTTSINGTSNVIVVSQSGGDVTGYWSVSGNVTGGNVTTGGVVSATGTVTGGNVATGGTVSATGNVTGGNVSTGGLVTATGNVTGGNLLTAGIMSATGDLFGNNLILNNGAINGAASGQITVNGASADTDFAVNGDTVANVFFVDAGTGTASFGSSTQTTNAIVAFNATNSILFPVGNTAQRPAVPVEGMVRYNTTIQDIEVYDADEWKAVGTPVFTVIVDDQFNGDGSQVNFTLSQSSTTAGVVVSINGVVQIPTTAYSVAGTTLTFTEAPQTGDVIDVRIFTTTTTVSSIENSSGNASVTASGTAAQILIEGDLLPTANVTYNLGSNAAQWNDLFLSGNTIYLGGLQLQASGNTFVVYQSDGVTQANIDVGNVDVSAINSGTSTIGITAPNGNAYVTVGGSANRLVVSTAGANIQGTLGVTGNITGNYILGNGSQLTGIDATSIQSGTSNVKVVSSGGNVTVAVGGTSNVAVFSTAGANVTGTLGVSGNITANYLFGNGSQLTGIDATSIQNGTANVRTFLNGNVTTSAAGTANVLVVTSTGANVAGTINATGNVIGGNVTTAGQVSATGNVTAGNLTVTTDAVITGNLTVNGTTTTINSNTVTTNDLLINMANNAATAAAANGGGIAVGPAGAAYASLTYNSTANIWTLSNGANTPGILSATGNITGGNILTGGAISATGNVSAGNIVTGGGSGGNISGANVISATTISATGNITGGNIITGGGSGGNITGANVISATTLSIGSIINSNANGVGNIGNATTYFNTVFAKATSAQYADLAEMYEADGPIEPGTVVAFGGSKEVTACDESGSRRVAGVVSTNPSYIMNAGLAGEHVVAVALTGRVPTRVTGTVRKGDLMVAAGAGRARAEANPQVGAVIGKALADFDGAEGTIEVVIGRF